AGKTAVEGKLAALQAVCEGAVELQEGKVGKAIRLDGKTGRVALQGDAAAGLNLKNLTVSVWVNAEDVTGRKGIISRNTWPTGYELFFWNGSLAVGAGASGGDPSQCRTGDGIYRPGEWYHVAATIESGKMMTLFVDGAEVKKAPLPQIIDLPVGQFLIGWNGWGGIQNVSTPGWFAGKIDELRVFDRVLTPEEIMAEWAGKRE
ncbi:MAG: LamG domain-containing protein, partial [Rectinemataceae bacterium]|nr:LamG domain-containing protein [Rectinemataceae bacterium]